MLILKVGGRVVEDAELRAQLLRTIAAYPEPVVLVHGGGNLASELSRQLGFEPQMVDGRRVTGTEDLRVAVMVYAGWLNKLLVAELAPCGKTAIGLSGADGDLIRARKRPVTAVGIDFGFVGDVERVNGGFLRKLIGLDLTPVICALTHDGAGQLLNTNADTIATEIAAAMAAEGGTVEFYSCLDQPGVMRDIGDAGSRIPVLAKAEYEAMREAGQVHSGMVPKLDTGFALLAAGVHVRLGDVTGIGHPEAGTRLG